jgi:uncharacterized membrane protein
MPLQWRLQVLEAGLTQRLGRPVQIVERDLFGLTGGARDRVLDAMTAGHDMPFVVVNDRVVHTGGLDVSSVSEAIARNGAA